MNQIKPLLFTTLLAGFAVVVGAWALGEARFGLGALAGALFSVANLAAFAWLGTRIFAGRASGSLLALKMVVNAAIVFTLIELVDLDPRGIAVGYGALVVGLVLATPTLRSDLAPKEEI